MLNVNEVFYSIQGEGTRAGRPCVFVRLTGCPLRCVWCDTAYAFHEGQRRGLDEIVTEASRHPVRLLCLTGGEPLVQREAFDLVRRFLDDGWEVTVETSGHVSLAPLDPRSVAIMDIKAPGSGEADRMDWANLERLKPIDEVKIVLGGREDYEWARDLIRTKGLAERGTVLFSPVHGALEPATLAGWVLEDALPVRLQLQLHKALWPGVKRGV